MNRHPSYHLNLIIAEYASVREFARAIGEDPSDIQRWRWGARKINPRAVISILRLHPNVKAHDLNPLVFPEDLVLKFQS